MCTERAPRVVGVVRRIGGAWLRNLCRMPEDRVDVALVVVSELVTNAVLHTTNSSLWYRSYCPGPGQVRIEVDDGSPSASPAPRQAPLLAESGRGLPLVAALVASLGGEWGFANAGTTAWCCFPIHDDQPVFEGPGTRRD
ncbi:ATP-binding protein [Streptomyces endophyticus]|uniref:ATP-binding protein n=1 Tax=Streptomyces endophyticus TaxID=714166 RepID=UPI00389AAE02